MLSINGKMLKRKYWE